MSLSEQIKSDFLTAFKAKQETPVSVLRLLKTALTNKEIEKKLPKGADLSDEEILAVIKTEIKKRQDSIESYTSANRTDLVEQEEKELKILKAYMPEPVAEEKIRAVVVSAIGKTGATSPADFGKVMGQAMAELKNQADGQAVSKIVKDVLGK